MSILSQTISSIKPWPKTKLEIDEKVNSQTNDRILLLWHHTYYESHAALYDDNNILSTDNPWNSFFDELDHYTNGGTRTSTWLNVTDGLYDDIWDE